MLIVYPQTCSRILLPPSDRSRFLHRFRKPGLESLARQAISKTVLSACKKCTMCPYCEAINGVVKKSGALKISHEPFRSVKMAEAKKDWMASFATAVAEQQAIEANLSRASEDLNPLKVLELFKRVTAEVYLNSVLSLMSLISVGCGNFSVASGCRATGRLYLAVHFCSSTLHPSIRGI